MSRKTERGEQDATKLGEDGTRAADTQQGAKSGDPKKFELPNAAREHFREPSRGGA